MHMLVCVKQVPDTTEIKMNPKTNTLDRSSASTIINPYDAHAVEEAVRIKNKYGGDPVVCEKCSEKTCSNICPLHKIFTSY